ncbi:hypothetical protein [Rhizobium sp. 18065]|uniref:hypothetical protein n=1 Tax=Rhizobium sp. 18065 TaxID=2681411 RepID=UPI00135798B6|nr:hypothetical protein [Rhizobium sp. 18065]
MTKMYDGLALGGPLDGKRVTHFDERYKVPEMNEVLPAFNVADMALKMSDLTYDVFEYVHVRTPGGDVWIPWAVQARKRYDHKIWDHPLEFIFSKLIRAYRPEGY